MKTITRSVEQLVATVDVDDDGYIDIQVTQPLNVDEARDFANAILQAAGDGERYLAEEAVATATAAVLAVGVGTFPVCAVCKGAVVPDEHSTHGFRHLVRPFSGGPIHVARVDGQAD
jgi:polyribonucleotide nucleotidyltransferase